MIKEFISMLAVAMLVGCATPASQQSMSVTTQDTPTALNANLKGKMAVGNVVGGEETNGMWMSKVDAKSFRAALDKSIAVAGYKSNDTTAAKYSVDADLQALDQPFGGFTMDVVSTVLYKITGDGKQIQFPVTATGTASTSDAFIGSERLRIANERSIKENIKQFLLKLSVQAGL